MNLVDYIFTPSLSHFIVSVFAIASLATNSPSASASSVAVVFDASKSMCGYLSQDNNRTFSRLTKTLRSFRDRRGDSAIIYYLNENNKAVPKVTTTSNPDFSNNLLRIEALSRESCDFRGDASPLQGVFHSSLRHHDLVLLITDGLLMAGNRTNFYDEAASWLRSGGNKIGHYSLGIIALRSPFVGSYWTEERSNCCEVLLNEPERPLYVLWYAKSGETAAAWVAQIQQELTGSQVHPLLFDVGGAIKGLTPLTELLATNARITTSVSGINGKPREECLEAVGNSVKFNRKCNDGFDPFDLTRTKQINITYAGLPGSNRSCSIVSENGKPQPRGISVSCQNVDRKSSALKLELTPDVELPVTINISQVSSSEFPSDINIWSSIRHPQNCLVPRETRITGSKVDTRQNCADSTANFVVEEKQRRKATFELIDWLGILRHRALDVAVQDNEIKSLMKTTHAITISKDR